MLPIYNTPHSSNMPALLDAQKDNPVISNHHKKDSNHIVPVHVLNYLTQNPATNSPPDDSVGDIAPVGLFALLEGNNFPQEMDKITHIVHRLPSYSYITNHNLKIQTINKIPTGIIKTQ